MRAPSEAATRGLVLIGYRGTGKTSVGRILAERLESAFIDTDVEVEALAGKSIPEIFAEHGETRFRDLEEEIVGRHTTHSRGAVLATGGGIILRSVNVERIRGHGLVVWLTAPSAILMGRISGDRQLRPALTAAGTLGEIDQVMRTREPLYRQAAHHAISTEGVTPSEVADRILLLLNGERNS